MNIMYQQSQMMMQQQLMQQQQQQTDKVEERLKSAWEESQEDVESTSEWHDNIEDEFYQEMKRLQQEVENYEDTIGGVTIEELAEAWSQANNEDIQQPRPYEFH